MLYIRGERCCDGLDGNMAMGLLARKVPPRAEGRERWVRYGYIPSFEWMWPSIHARPLFHGCCLMYARVNRLHSCNPSVGFPTFDNVVGHSSFGFASHICSDRKTSATNLAERPFSTRVVNLVSAS